ncbi:MAG: MBL fold metallo-hydrolase [Lachnospiraceae bacterium]|nr:MBL fold metallo-hydrolase [Lachnospiraceae bacterium]
MSEIRIKSLLVGMVQTNCYLVYDEETKRGVIIDPGDSANLISSKCKEFGIKPEAILLTHGHFDHILAARELKEEWNVKIYSSEKEVEILEDGSKNMMLKWFRKAFSLTPDVTLTDGETFELAGFTWKMLLTPGHTIGSCCYYIEEEEVLFAGDTLFQNSYGRIDLPTGNAMDMVASVKKLLTLPEDVMVYPGHMDVTTIGHEKKYNPLARY